MAGLHGRNRRTGGAESPPAMNHPESAVIGHHSRIFEHGRHRHEIVKVGVPEIVLTPVTRHATETPHRRRQSVSTCVFSWSRITLRLSKKVASTSVPTSGISLGHAGEVAGRESGKTLAAEIRFEVLERQREVQNVDVRNRRRRGLRQGGASGNCDSRGTDPQG